MLLSYHQFLNQIDEKHKKRIEHWQVGPSTYVKPYKNRNSSSFRYNTFPKRVKFLTQCLNEIPNPKRNTYFRTSTPPAEVLSALDKIHNNLNHYNLETLLPFLKTDLEIQKRVNRKFCIDENIRGMFLIILGSYPQDFFSQPQFQANTLDDFLH